MAMASAGPYASLHLIADNHANIPPLSFLQAGCPSRRPTNSVKALNLKAHEYTLNGIDVSQTVLDSLTQFGLSRQTVIQCVTRRAQAAGVPLCLYL